MWNSHGYGPAALLLLLLHAGCAPPCGQVCRKVLDCELDSERVSFEECEAACRQQQALYLEWENRELQAAFDDHRSCVAQSSCEELADGTCFNEDLWAF